MRPTRSQLQRYMLAAERTPTVDANAAAWARGVLEEALLRADRADRVSPEPPEPKRIAYHTR